MTAHKGLNLAKLTAGRWTPQDVKENSAPIRVVDDSKTCAAASGDTLKMVAPPAYAKLDLMTSVIFVSSAGTAVFDIGSDSGSATAASCLFAGATAPTGKKFTFDAVAMFNKEWDGGKLMFTFSGSYTVATLDVYAQLAYKDVP